MKISDIITEERAGKVNKDLEDKSRGLIRFRDNGGYDRTYHLNRVMMAAAMHDGASEDAIERSKMDPASFVEKYNTGHPYTKQEWNMLKGALKTIGADKHDLVPFSSSQENKEINRTSVGRNPGPITRKK